jgi:hypothetical protein
MGSIPTMRETGVALKALRQLAQKDFRQNLPNKQNLHLRQSKTVRTTGTTSKHSL